MIRLNDSEPGVVTGVTLEKVTGDLYLLHAITDEIRVEMN